MGPSETTLSVEAKRAYERGRFLAALRVLALVLPATAAAAILTFSTAVPLVIGVVLAVITVGLLHRGGAYGRAVYPGLAGGFSAAALAIFLRRSGFCSPEEEHMCMMMSLLGGAIAGVIVTRRALRIDAHRAAFLISGAAVVFLAGSLGCACFGISGLSGLAIGVALGAIPVAVIARVVR